jgi:branched-chain amino acid transport system permease protein
MGARMSLRHWTDLLNTFVLLAGPLLLLAILLKFADWPIMDHIVTEAFLDLILVVGLQIFMGNTGILGFAHIGFMGIGAYTSAIFSMTPMAKSLALPTLYPFLADIQLPILVAIVLGGLVAALVAALVGIALMRLTEFAAVITAFALLVIIHTVLVHWTALTNGPHTLFGLDRHTYLLGSALWAIFFIAVAIVFKESKVGLQLRASRDDPISASAIGVDTIAVRWIAFVLSAFVAGMGGGLWAHFITSFSPTAFFLKVTFVVLAMLVIGGPATVSGAVVGTVVVSFVYQGLRAIENAVNMAQLVAEPVVGLTDVCLAIALIMMLIIRPLGLIERNELRLYWPRRNSC